MSIMHEYEQIKRILGDDEWHKIQCYLESHPDLLLSDVLYNEETFNNYLKWKEQQKS